MRESTIDLSAEPLYVILVSHVERREDPRGTSQSSLKNADELSQPTTVRPAPRRGAGRGTQPETIIRDSSLTQRGVGSLGDDTTLLLPSYRQPRPGDVSTGTNLPEYGRSMGRDYPMPARKRSTPAESSGFDYYVGYPPDHEQPLPYVD